jgi:hypothetical protein
VRICCYAEDGSSSFLQNVGKTHDVIIQEKSKIKKKNPVVLEGN